MTAEPVWIEWTSGFTYAMAAFPPEPCWHCGHPTVWVDFDFEARLCPEVCAEAKWLEYQLALRSG